MKKSIWIFLLAVLLPSIVLGWLALRSAEEQQIILERRTAELYQKESDAVAESVRTLVDGERRAFSETLRRLLEKEGAAKLAGDFSAQLAAEWPRKAVGFAVAGDNRLLSPSPQAVRSNTAWGGFLTENGSFLSNRSSAQVYTVPADELTRADAVRKKSLAVGSLALNAAPSSPVALKDQKQDAVNEESKALARAPALAPAVPPASRGVVGKERAEGEMAAQKAVPLSRAKPKNESAFTIGGAKPGESSPKAPAPAAPAPMPAQKAAEPAAVDKDRAQFNQMRNVAPQRLPEENQMAMSQLIPETTEFRTLTEGAEEGVLTRFTADRLQILFWQRAPQAPGVIFGCVLQPEDLRDLWTSALPAPTYWGRRVADTEYVLALLDDKARPIAIRPEGGKARDWKHPFVASEIGEVLPHWEAALYLIRPQQLEESARDVRRTLMLLIAAAIGAIACGGWIVVADARRQMALAQQKTDFVSNVSHELKTPLTSIRMFAELMQNGAAEAKRSQYLRIIMVEAERLTRLINNVLDFARLERRQKHYDKKPFDLHALLTRTWEGQELHLRESGFATRWDADPAPYPILGDEDALAQVLVNLLSNAEKYTGDRKEVELRSTLADDHVRIAVLDRGLGVPAGQERKIFEAFHRAHDSLASGIQGSGLGLTLAQRLAAEHGGTIDYAPREGGGSIFTLSLPLGKK